MHGSIPLALPIKKETRIYPFSKAPRAVQYVNTRVQAKLQNQAFFPLWLGWFCSCNLLSWLPGAQTRGFGAGRAKAPLHPTSHR